MDKFLLRYCQGLQVITVGCLAVMVVLVLGNVVLRYVFNSGIAVAEEVSRWLFVWVTFLGAIFALREHGHLGTEMLVGKLGSNGKKFCLVIGYALMLMVCWMLFQGALAQTRLNWNVTAPSSGLSLAWFYSVGIVFSVSAAAILLNDAFKLVTGRVADADLIIVKESEDQP
ncbi:TRAP transporter small permease [soil metagenome]